MIDNIHLLKLINVLRYYRILYSQKSRVKAFLRQNNICIYYGCGSIHQSRYINVDIRWTPAVDLLGDLEWCSLTFEKCCNEVYMSHVLEHYASPGKSMRDDPSTVIGAMKAVGKMLKQDGIFRLAVPDFEALARIYSNRRISLYPRILGRLCGEQNYSENLHRCLFDREFLTMCLSATGFSGIEEWDPKRLDLNRDASFDELDGIKTSLNLVARKSSHP